MRSSVEEFLLFCNQIRQRSAIVQVGCCLGRVQSLQIEGRIFAADVEVLGIRGRGCEVEFSLRGAVFERTTLSSLPVVRLSLEAACPTWEIRWGKRTFALLWERSLGKEYPMR